MDMQVKVCDIVPVVGQETGRWTITAPNGERLVADLCAEHAEPVAVLVEKIKGARTTSAPSRTVNVSRRTAAKKATTGARGRRVTTLSEIESRKH